MTHWDVLEMGMGEKRADEDGCRWMKRQNDRACACAREREKAQQDMAGFGMLAGRQGGERRRWASTDSDVRTSLTQSPAKMNIPVTALSWKTTCPMLTKTITAGGQ